MRNTHTCAHVHTRTYTCVRTLAHRLIHKRASTHTQTYPHKHTHTNIPTYVSAHTPTTHIHELKRERERERERENHTHTRVHTHRSGHIHEHTQSMKHTLLLRQRHTHKSCKRERGGRERSVYRRCTRHHDHRRSGSHVAWQTEKETGVAYTSCNKLPYFTGLRASEMNRLTCSTLEAPDGSRC